MGSVYSLFQKWINYIVNSLRAATCRTDDSAVITPGRFLCRRLLTGRELWFGFVRWGLCSKLYLSHKYCRAQSYLQGTVRFGSRFRILSEIFGVGSVLTHCSRMALESLRDGTKSGGPVPLSGVGLCIYPLTYVVLFQTICSQKISLYASVQGIVLLSLSFRGLQCGQHFTFVFTSSIVISNIVKNPESGLDPGLKMWLFL